MYWLDNWQVIGTWVGALVGFSFVLLFFLMIGTCIGISDGSSLVPLLELLLGMALGNIIGSLIVFPNNRFVFDSLVRYLDVMIIENPPGSLIMSSFGMSPYVLLENCTVSLLRKFT